MTKRVIDGSVTVTGPPSATWRANSSIGRAAGAQDVPEADAGKPGSVGALVVRGRRHELLREQLAGAHDRGRVGGLVGRGEDHRLDIGGQAGVDHVLRAADVRLGDLERVVLARFDVLQRSAVEDDVDVLGGAHQPIAIADVAHEEADVAAAAEQLALVELLGLVAAENADDGRPRGEELSHEVRAHGPGAAGHENAPAADRIRLAG